MNNDDFPATQLSEAVRGKVTVNLQKSNLSKDGNTRFYGKVERNTYTMKNVLDVMKNDGQLLDLGTITSILNSYSSAVYKILKSGNAVKFGRMGTFYIAGEGSVSSEDEKPHLTVKFTVSDEFKSSINDIEIKSSGYSVPKMSISEIVNITECTEDSVLSAGCTVEIKGSKLKVSGKDSGVFFVPVSENGLISKNEEEWTKLENPLYVNVPSRLMFTVPENISEGKYCIVIRSRYTSKTGHERKTMLETISDAVTFKSKN